ncbi:GntP family permease [bacterium]|nr:GntP family permease [bacterium]
MSPTAITLAIILAGIVVVIAGVLVFRLHAFLALIFGAIVVAVLTPTANVRQNSLRTQQLQVASQDGQQFVLVLPKDYKVPIDSVCYVFEQLPDGDNEQPAGSLVVTDSRKVSFEDGRVQRQVIARKSPGSGDWNFDDPFVVTNTGLAAANSLAKQTIGKRIANAFGSTCGKVGILIGMASIIGICLLESGAADRIVRSALNAMGEKSAPFAFIGSGFMLGIPVFFDTVFYLMIPLGKALRMRTGRNYLLYVLTIIIGGTMAHSLVPPTPGPLFVAEQLGVDLGVMMLGGCVVCVFTSIYGYIHASLMNRFFELPLRESPDLPLAELEKLTQRDESQLPGLFVSVLPIVLPVVLIAGNTIIGRFSDSFSPGFLKISANLGDKNIALVLSTIIALWILVRQKGTLKELSPSIQSAIASAGGIILITAAGGAFGKVLQQTGVAGLINDMPKTSPAMIVTIAFLITTAIRTAQGSATVAMITAVGILSGLAASGDLGFDPLYLALAIGCGSKPIGWMNDSGFWVMTKMSGMTEGEGLKYITPMASMMGVVGLLVVIVGVSVYPTF